MEAPLKTVRVLISGRVQGVWYRAWTQGEAQKLGVQGWVRNRRDGTVEALMSGEEHQVDALLAKCRKGPPLARVDGIDISPDNPPSDPGFHKLPTV